MVELYTIQRYLQYDDLKKQGLEHFDYSYKTKSDSKWRKKIELIHGISLTHITKISNNTQKDFVNIEDFIEHETMIVNKKKLYC